MNKRLFRTIPHLGGVCSLMVVLTLAVETRADDSIDFKVRIQPRADVGDFTSAASSGCESQLDLYIRRARLELLGRPTDGLFYILGLSGDRAGQRGSANSTELAYAFVNYRLAPALQLRAGLVKLPLSRGGWVSSARLLLIERTQTVSMAAAAFGRYITPHLALHGRSRGGTIGYSVAVTDGLQPGDSDRRFSGATVSASDNPGLVLRFEVSPGGWGEEGRESGSHLGVGRHLTIGLNGAVQNGIQFDVETEDRAVVGGDLSFHQGGLTFRSEYLRVRRERRDGLDLSPAGWYVQIGFYINELRLEPAARLERYDADLPGGDDVTATYTGGINWYRSGHDLKLMANVAHTRFQRSVRQIDSASARTALQLQSQMYF